MSRALPVLFGLLSFCPVTAAAQHDGAIGAAVRKRGAVYKHEVDDLIGVLRTTARRGQAGAAGVGVLGSDVRSTAQILAAMGRCHRRYHISDGPVVRPSLNYLLENRKADGTFGDASTTGWVIEALRRIDPDGCAEEIRTAAASLGGGEQAESPFDELVADVLDEVRADRFPQHLAAAEATQAERWYDHPDTLERPAAAVVLAKLVACQVANRELDRGSHAQDPVATWSESQQRAFAYLFQKQKGGIFSVPVPTKNDAGETVVRMFPDPAFTGFGLMALQSKPKQRRTAAEQAAIEAGLKWLLTQQNDDGTFGRTVTNYTTCVVVGALVKWDDPARLPALKKAQKAILMFQNTEQAGYSRSDRDYGSIGYGNSQRGDLSNLHFSIEALRATGLPADHEALQKALVFLQRTQNLKATNDFAGKIPHPQKEGETLEVRPGDDGGATYYPGNSNAGYVVQPDGTAIARSYGSMTYALLKSYTLAGVEGDDPRVQAAVRWISSHWTLAINPGSDPALGEKTKYAGLFYYYMVLAQALDAAGIDYVEATETADGGVATRKVDWRKELRAHLAKIQREDGSWLNGKNGRWYEDQPLLCTCYAMVALEHCR
ncbi:MAG TPA: hypothetical protein ENI87_02530 [bacterium]|nr:hypothetical protein [bacterium]